MDVWADRRGKNLRRARERTDGRTIRQTDNQTDMGEYLIGGHFVSVVHQNTCFDAFSLNLIVTQQYQSHLSYSKKLFTQYDI